MAALAWQSTNRRRLLLFSSCLGSLAWIAFVCLIQPGWAPALFLLAPLVVVPIGLRLLDDDAISPWLQVFTALSLLPAFSFDAGAAAGALALPWFLFTVLLAWQGGRMALQGRVVGVSLVYLAVGGGWLVLSRLGMRPLDFPDVIVLATAVHFHYAGFALPVLAWRVGNKHNQIWTIRTLYALLVGVPLVALGITLSAFQVGFVEPLATVFLSLACWVHAWFQFRRSFAFAGWRRQLLQFSSISLTIAMGLAVLYAAGNFLGTAWLKIPLMLRLHGTIQVLGFALPALIALNLQNPTEPEA